jgi:hypothetical protein
MLDDQQHGFDRGLPFRNLLFGRRQLLDIFRGILKGDELSASWQRNRIVEGAGPISHGAAAMTG